MAMTEKECEAALRRMSKEVEDPLGGVLRALFNMIDAERAKVAQLQHDSSAFESGRRLERVHVLRYMREREEPELDVIIALIERGDHTS